LLGLTGAFVLDDPEDADIRNNVDEEVLAFIEGMVGAEIASYIRKQRDDYRKGGSALSPSGT